MHNGLTKLYVDHLKVFTHKYLKHLNCTTTKFKIYRKVTIGSRRNALSKTTKKKRFLS